MDDIIIKTTPTFEKQSNKLLSKEAKEQLYDCLSLQPTAGSIIPGSGGIRILYHYTEGLLIIIITLYAKAKKETINQSEKNELKRLLPRLIERYKLEINDE